eukprot:787473-Alexandrium_andersonii.AAC.1
MHAEGVKVCRRGKPGQPRVERDVWVLPAGHVLRIVDAMVPQLVYALPRALPVPAGAAARMAT